MPVERFTEVLQDLRSKILDGTYPVGEPLPHTDQLRATYSVAPATITRAMKALKDEGLIWRVANKGMIVQGPAVVIEIPMRAERRDEVYVWANACRRAGTRGLLTITGGARRDTATEDVARALQLQPGDPIVTWERRGDIGGHLVCLDHFSVSEDRHAANAYDVERSSGAVGLATRVRPAEPKEASRLKVSRGAPLLDVSRVTYDHTGQPLHLLRRVVNPQRVHLVERGIPL